MPYLLSPVPAMLGIRPGSKVSVLNPPKGFVQRLNPLPDGVEFLVTAQTGLDVILFFTESKLELVERLPALSRAMTLTGGIWVFWQKSQSMGRYGLSEDFIRMAAMELGLVDNKLYSLDEDWTGLRLVRRRPGTRPERPTDTPRAEA